VLLVLILLLILFLLLILLLLDNTEPIARQFLQTRKMKIRSKSRMRVRRRRRRKSGSSECTLNSLSTKTGEDHRHKFAALVEKNEIRAPLTVFREMTVRVSRTRNNS